MKNLRRLETSKSTPNTPEGDLHEMIADELADTVIYADLLCHRLGLSLGKAVQRKFNATSAKVGSEVTL